MIHTTHNINTPVAFDRASAELLNKMTRMSITMNIIGINHGTGGIVAICGIGLLLTHRTIKIDSIPTVIVSRTEQTMTVWYIRDVKNELHYPPSLVNNPPHHHCHESRKFDVEINIKVSAVETCHAVGQNATTVDVEIGKIKISVPLQVDIRVKI